LGWRGELMMLGVSPVFFVFFTWLPVASGKGTLGGLGVDAAKVFSFRLQLYELQ
jgi:hypothetical protein